MFNSCSTTVSINRLTRLTSHLLCSSFGMKTSKTQHLASITRPCCQKTSKEDPSKPGTFQDEEDPNLPNETWTPETLELYVRLKAEAEQSGGSLLKRKTPPKAGNRLYPRCVDEQGKMFEYSMFINISKEQLKGVCQFGPYTEGPSGFVHGGALATIMDSMLGVCVNQCGYTSVTANLSVDFKVALRVGSTVLIETKVERVDGRKVFSSGEMKSPDGCQTYVTCTGLFIQVNKQYKKN